MNNNKKNYVIASHKYFELFGSYDLNGLKDIYDTNIHLIDWNGEWIGVESVLQMNESIFNSKPIITVLEVIQADKEESNQRTYCKIQIQIDDVTLKVMDVIDWNDKHKIIKIEAFNG
jgi:hypothetical protein